MQSGAARTSQKAARSMLLIIYMIATPGITSATRWDVTGCANSITATVAMTKNISGARKRKTMSNQEQPGAASSSQEQSGAAMSSQEQPRRSQELPWGNQE